MSMWVWRCDWTWTKWVLLIYWLWSIKTRYCNTKLWAVLFKNCWRIERSCAAQSTKKVTHNNQIMRKTMEKSRTRRKNWSILYRLSQFAVEAVIDLLSVRKSSAFMEWSEYVMWCARREGKAKWKDEMREQQTYHKVQIEINRHIQYFMQIIACD